MTDVNEVAIADVGFSALYREQHLRVLAYFLRRFDRQTAIDCAAEVFTVTWRRWGDVPESGRDAVRWMYGVCRHVARNQRRSRRRLWRLRARLSQQAPLRPVQPDAEVVRRSEEQLVTAALSRLRDRDQEILRLVAWEQLPRPEVARILGCSTHAADQRFQRAVNRLRDEFNKSLSPEGTSP